MRDYPVSAFKYGVVNVLEASSIPDGAASASLNWITKGDKIELSRGFRLVGDAITGTGRVTGLHKAYKADGTPVWFKVYGRKVFYTTDSANGPWTEIGTDLLPVAADGEDVFFSNYASLAGAQVWFGSPNSSLYKIMTANPGSYADVYNASKNFKGLILIRQNRMWLWRRNEDKTGVYGSYIDTATYTTVTGEATGSLGGTLAFKAGGATRTCFGVTLTITASGEVYTDDYNGVLTGSLGGTGTINYMTGAYTVSNSGVGTVDYQWEDSNNNGISDFTKSSTRLAGQGFVFRQDDGGGDLMNIFTIGDTEYCFHEYKTWVLTLTADDTNATNDIFRQNVGIPYPRAAVASSVGIFYMDVTEPSKPLFRRLALDSGSSEVIPKTVIENFDFTGYDFSLCAMKEWNEYILFSAMADGSIINDRTFLYHKDGAAKGALDIRDYCVSVFEDGDGTLIAGESISKNVVELFSGFDDDDSLISNHWVSNFSRLGLPRQRKKTRYFVLEGEIQINQSYDVYYETDFNGLVKVGTVVGTGGYVDRGQPIAVGAVTIGSKEVGGGSSGIEAYHYLRQIDLRSSKFDMRRLRFVATGIGYVSISLHEDHDIKIYQTKIPRKYET